MKKAISKALLRLAGWKLGPVVEDVPKCVICVAPHTSNWDFIVGKLFYTSIGRNASFLIKKEWFFFPLGLIFKAVGGQFNRRKEFQLAVTPEGTRKRVNDWKKGFYYIAQKANVPILMAYFDYKKKEAGFKGVFYPTGDADKDIRDIREHYRGVTACHPENFAYQYGPVSYYLGGQR